MKIEDLTLKEIKKHCETLRTTLNENLYTQETCYQCCPFYRMVCDEVRPCDWTTEDMERDIEGVSE